MSRGMWIIQTSFSFNCCSLYWKKSFGCAIQFCRGWRPQGGHLWPFTIIFNVYITLCTRRHPLTSSFHHLLRKKMSKLKDCAWDLKHPGQTLCEVISTEMLGVCSYLCWGKSAAVLNVACSITLQQVSNFRACSDFNTPILIILW